MISHSHSHCYCYKKKKKNIFCDFLNKSGYRATPDPIKSNIIIIHLEIKKYCLEIWLNETWGPYAMKCLIDSRLIVKAFKKKFKQLINPDNNFLVVDLWYKPCPDQHLNPFSPYEIPYAPYTVPGWIIDRSDQESDSNFDANQYNNSNRWIVNQIVNPDNHYVKCFMEQLKQCVGKGNFSHILDSLDKNALNQIVSDSERIKFLEELNQIVLRTIYDDKYEYNYESYYTKLYSYQESCLYYRKSCLNFHHDVQSMNLRNLMMIEIKKRLHSQQFHLPKVIVPIIIEYLFN